MKELLKKILFIFGYQLSSNFVISKLYKKNAFNTKYNKKVLIAYITKPFFEGINYSHTNSLECLTAAEIFNNLGYRVDVIDYNLTKKINYAQYDIIYGMGSALERAFYYQGTNKQLRIFYATGCNPIYSDVATTLRAREFYLEHNIILMNSARIVRKSQHAQILLSDAVIVLGNKNVLDTYTNIDPQRTDRYIKLNAFFYDTYNINLEKKDFSKAKKHFLWFGSGGLLHKGLDILIDIFSKREDIHLHICGNLSNEKGFFNYYKYELTNKKNIIYHGFIDIRSKQFKSIMDICGFVIFPSVSEGGSPALLNTIANGGLIPIITKLTGLDLSKYGWIIDKPKLKNFEMAIDMVLKLENDELKQKAINIKKHVRAYYSYNKYKENLTNIITGILEKNHLI